jgi:ribonucleoside-triphosphate reductase
MLESPSWINAEENPEITMKTGVKQAPTLVLYKEDGIEKIENLSNIKKFIEESKQ